LDSEGAETAGSEAAARAASMPVATTKANVRLRNGSVATLFPPTPAGIRAVLSLKRLAASIRKSARVNNLIA
jgi:hypothetical protein